jgi:DNA-binding transcriptional regulator YhcF (GntR family)
MTGPVIDVASSVPPYEQVRVHFARQIRNHALAVGSKLPTVRALAAELGLAANTVARAYRELEEAGLIETRGRNGSFVSAAADLGRERVRRVAEEYAAAVAGVGLDRDEALRIVTAALDAHH